MSTPALVGEGLAKRCFPDLFAAEDKDGLIAASLLEPIQPGLYRRGPLVAFAHPFFRRSLSRLNNLNTSIKPGVTQHGADDRQRLFSQVSRTEFWWQSRRNDLLGVREHIFEAEELREHYTFGSDDELYGCRYVHSIISEKTKKIEHLDGAIREYTDESLLERLEKDIAQAGRHTKYTKYWRADGILPLSNWKSLVYHHFRDNPLV